MRVSGLLVAMLLLAPGCAVVQTLLAPSKRPAHEAPVSTPPALPPPPAVVPTPSPPPIGTPALTVQRSPDEERRLRDDAQKKLDETDRLLRQLEGRFLKPNEREMLVLAQSFVEQARKALAAQEYERASTLTAKARTLADDLAAATK